MLLNSNTEKVMNLVDMIDDLKGVDKVRLAIHLLEESCFSSKYDEKFIELLNEVLEKQKFLIELLFNIFQYDFNNEEINTKINQQLNVYDYCYSLNVL